MIRRPVPGLLAASIAICWPLSALASGGDDHTHGDEPKMALQAAAPRVVATSDLFELVGVLAADGLVLYVARPDTTEPVTSASISVDVDGQNIVATPGELGTYQLTGNWATRAGEHAFVFTVVNGEETDLLAGTLTIPSNLGGHEPHLSKWWWLLGAVLAAALLAALAAYWRSRQRRSALGTLSLAGIVLALVIMPTESPASGGDDHTHGEEEALGAAQYVLGAPDAPRRLPNGSLFVPVSTQRLLELRTAVLNSSEASRAIQFPGRLVPDPSRSGIVQSASGGRIIATGGGLPKLGSNVKRGDVLFYVEPSASGGDLSGIAQERLQVLEELEVAKRRLMRLESLQGTIAGREIDEAKLRVDTLEKRASGLNSGESRREALRAPVSGRVGRMDVVAGQVVSPERVLVEIVAPDALIVEGAIHGSSQLAQKGAARLPDGRSLNLKLLGQGSALANQAVAVRFAVAETDATTDLPINTPVSVIAQLAEQQNGIVVPRDAIVQSTAGTPMVWVKVAPETFSPRDVRIEEHDGDSVLVVAGLKPPARVVVDGSALINQIR